MLPHFFELDLECIANDRYRTQRSLSVGNATTLTAHDWIYAGRSVGCLLGRLPTTSPRYLVFRDVARRVVVPGSQAEIAGSLLNTFGLGGGFPPR